MRPAHAHAVPIAGPVHANNAEILAAFAERGVGVLLEPDFVVAPQVRAGTLVPILPGYVAATIPVHAVYPSRRHLSAKVRAFIDFLVARFADVRRGTSRRADVIPRSRRRPARPRATCAAGVRAAGSCPPPPSPPPPSGPPGPSGGSPPCGMTSDDDCWRRISCSSRIARSTPARVASA